MKAKSFFETLKARRMELRMTLREFCRIAGEDPANYSRVERGIKVAPGDEVLERYGKALRYSGKELQDFITLGALSRKNLPKHLTEEELAGKLPAFLRLINGEYPTEEQLREAVMITREAHK